MKKRTFPLYVKVLLTYSIVVIVLLIVLLAGRQIMDNRVRNYLTDKFYEQVDEIEESLESYIASGDNNRIGVYASNYNRRGYYFKVYDKDGELIFETNLNNGGPLSDINGLINDGTITIGEYKPKSQLDDESNMAEDKNITGQEKNIVLQKETRELYVDSDEGNEYLGYVEISYITVDNLMPQDADFMDEFFNIYQVMIIVVLVLAIFLSLWVSKGITRPIEKVIQTTGKIRKGDLDERVEITTRTTELLELKNAINYLAESLQEEDELREQMTSDMAHEIRTPVNNVQNILEAMIDGIWDADEANLNKCRNEVLRINKLVDELKSISTIEVANMHLNNENFDAVLQSKDIISMFKVKAGEKGVNIELSGDEQVNVLMDPAKYNQILGNLISNGIRYCFDNTAIMVNIEKNGDDLILSVMDQGIGIKEEHLKHIFERFYRTDESRNKETGGLGLGLTIVEKIVHMYNGKITVKSKPEEGTIFEIVLPVVV